MKATVFIGDFAYPLYQISESEMDDILGRLKMKDLVGVPMCFDLRRRLWPHPDGAVKEVVWTE